MVSTQRIESDSSDIPTSAGARVEAFGQHAHCAVRWCIRTRITQTSVLKHLRVMRKTLDAMPSASDQPLLAVRESSTTPEGHGPVRSRSASSSGARVHRESFVPKHDLKSELDRLREEKAEWQSRLRDAGDATEYQRQMVEQSNRKLIHLEDQNKQLSSSLRAKEEVQLKQQAQIDAMLEQMAALRRDVLAQSPVKETIDDERRARPETTIDDERRALEAPPAASSIIDGKAAAAAQTPNASIRTEHSYSVVSSATMARTPAESDAENLPNARHRELFRLSPDKDKVLPKPFVDYAQAATKPTTEPLVKHDADGVPFYKPVVRRDILPPDKALGKTPADVQ